jgi:trans-aconitate methyltransferase
LAAAAKDWSPETYARFRGLRLRPALDLLAQVDGLPEGDVVDLGCGNGAVAPDLRARFCAGGARRLIGVDTSPAMVAEAEATGLYDRLEAADAADWAPRTAPALIFSNAALHWLPDHARLMPHLARLVAPGGLLAVQMPRQYGAPSHRFLRDIAGAMFPDRFTTADGRSPVMAAGEYWRLLSPLGRVKHGRRNTCSGWIRRPMGIRFAVSLKARRCGPFLPGWMRMRRSGSWQPMKRPLPRPILRWRMAGCCSRSSGFSSR